MEDKIDFVVTFVDMSDPVWMNNYNEFIRKNNIPLPEFNNVELRSRDYGTLQCLFRSIEIHAPWINNVFLVVQSESQVPKWVNRETVKVVLHEDFIPKEFLPTYNTYVMQAHLHLIPGLSEKFISSDDDSIFVNDVVPENFFIDNKVVQTILESDQNISSNTFEKYYHYYKMESSEIAKKTLEIHNEFYYQTDHSMNGMFKSINKELYDSLDIHSLLTPFRERGNIMRNTFVTYTFLKRRTILVPHGKNAPTSFKNTDYNKFIQWLRKIRYKDQISVNSNYINENICKELYYKLIEDAIFSLFPEKSKKYEI